MKKILQFICSFVIAMCVLAFISFFTMQIQILDPVEQTKLKEGKTFWQWNSPYGDYNLHYIERGEGPNHVVLLHGFRANTFTWRYLIDPLAQAGFHIWAMDFIGYGFSDKPENIQYNLDFFLEQIEAFMKEKEIPRAHFIGSSMGGGLALSMALSHPERIHSLTLISALGYPLDLPLYISIGRHFGQLWMPFLGPTMIRKGLEQIVYEKESVTDDQVQAYSLPYCFPGGAMASLNTLKNFDNERLIALSQRYVSEIQCPLLVIWGDCDTLIPLEHFERFCQDFPRAEKLLIKECGHIPHEEKPEQVKTAIIQFLSHIVSN